MLTPTYLKKSKTISKNFHNALKNTCDIYNPSYYPKFKKWCDEYFFLPHRNEPRGLGGIFFDNLENNFEQNFNFISDIGKTFSKTFSKIVMSKINNKWNQEQKNAQLIKRGRYVEFNLLYDRGTAFGLQTKGNVDAIFMSLPPEVSWK